jgi:bacillithiol biosynthesis deacetylase BshB1
LSPSDRLDVLAFAPHPDDLELCCGGTLLRLIDAGHKVGLADLTRGDRGTRGTPEIRLVEAEAARVAMGAHLRTNLGFPDLGVDARDRAQLRKVVEAIRRHRPRLVLTCSEHDHHPDHVEAAHLVERGVYVAGLAGFDADGEPFRPARLLFYMGRVVFEPKLIVDVSEVWERRMAVASCFRSQFFREPDDPKVTPISEPGFMDQVAARFRHFGSRIGVTYAEPFDLREPFGLMDVGPLLQGVSP